ncbi:MAG: hypothetical protein HN909_00730 [Phycisphaerales bacterium]|jgi:hypothetical protein|nr:hypothetical protein [Phycisphaerales bacterium]MBT7170274.1 hypothetical protein [Phycisphaerales bacterium]
MSLLEPAAEARVERARALYHGPEGYNCAQAILATFADVAEGVGPAQIDEFGVCGGGNAKAGVCGALYAAQRLLNEQGRELLQPFVDAYGSPYCEDLIDKKCCPDLVAAAARLVDAISQTHPLTFQA